MYQSLSCRFRYPTRTVGVRICCRRMTKAVHVSVKVSIMDFQFIRCAIVLFALAVGNFANVQEQCGHSLVQPNVVLLTQSPAHTATPTDMYS